MRLMFIASSDGYNGENGDLFVIAETIGEAKRLWRDFYELDPGDEPDRIFELPFAPKQFEPKPRAFKWHGGLLNGELEEL